MPYRHGKQADSRLVTAEKKLSRRGLLLAGASVALGGCRRCQNEPSNSNTAPSELRIEVLSFSSSPVGRQAAVILLPTWPAPPGGFPILIALHGRGEAYRGIDRGAWGWVRDYHLDKTWSRLRHPPLKTEDLAGCGTETYLKNLNDRLGNKPWPGLVVVCPFTPDLLASKKLGGAEPFASFVVDSLLPRVQERFKGMVDGTRVGIDGVSLGGRVALLTALQIPERFRSVGTMQAAFRQREIPSVARMVARAWGRKEHAPHLRLLTSDQDPLRPALTQLHQALLRKNVGHDWTVAPGPHDYVFNRGPGGYEMLLWQRSVLSS